MLALAQPYDSGLEPPPSHMAVCTPGRGCAAACSRTTSTHTTSDKCRDRTVYTCDTGARGTRRIATVRYYKAALMVHVKYGLKKTAA